jgi:hypothetical protein
MRNREIGGSAGMTLMTGAGLAVTAVLLLHAASTLPAWCAWLPVAVWLAGLAVLGRMTWQDWRETLRP